MWGSLNVLNYAYLLPKSRYSIVNQRFAVVFIQNKLFTFMES
jgi:hypothetical protein